MTNPASYTIHAWATTATETLYGSHLNVLGSVCSALLNKGITGANIATGGIDAAALFAGSVITEGSIDYGTGDGLGVVQIGKDRTTTGGQMSIKGTSLITAANTTNTDITVYFTNGDVCTAGDPGYTAAPHAYATAYTANTDMCINIKACATNSMQINVDLGGTATFTENWTIYWQAFGDV